MGDLAKSHVLVPPRVAIATKIVQLFDSYTYTHRGLEMQVSE